MSYRSCVAVPVALPLTLDWRPGLQPRPRELLMMGYRPHTPVVLSGRRWSWRAKFSRECFLSSRFRVRPAGESSRPASRPRLSKAGGGPGRRLLPLSVSAVGGGADQSTFLSLEEAGLIEMSNLDMHERFLTRLTVSSLNLLRVISEQEGVPIEQLNAGKICDWFVKDKEKRARNIDEATLKWDSHDW